MRRLACAVVLGLFTFMAASAQDQSEIISAALYLSGAGTDEDISPEWISRLEALSGRKISVNARRLRSYGLLTPYQEAAILDYRGRCGDILSWEELSLVDGFSREAVDALRPFLSLHSDRVPGTSDTLRLKASALLRTTLSSIGGKARLTGSWWRAGTAYRGKDWTFFAEAEAGAFRFVLGDYNIRFGQGLTHWSGFSMDALSSVEAFIKRAGGLTPVWSYSSADVHRGIAAEYSSRHVRGVVFLDKKLMAGAHADYYGKCFQTGFTVITEGFKGMPSFSLDGTAHLGGVLLAGEVGLRSSSFSGTGSAIVAIPGGSRLSFQLRGIPSAFSGKKNGEYGFAAGYDYSSEKRRQLHGKSGFGSSVPVHSFSFTADAALLPIPGGDTRRFQLRAYTQWRFQALSHFAVLLRFTERYRNYERPRSAIRADIVLGTGPWSGTLRSELVYCEKLSFLTYAEGGYKGKALGGYLRLTAFSADSWADRIYTYERDAPGTFSVPAYYGKGLSAALMGSWKYKFRWLIVKAYLRAAYTIKKEHKPAPVLNFQLMLEI